MNHPDHVTAAGWTVPLPADQEGRPAEEASSSAITADELIGKTLHDSAGHTLKATAVVRASGDDGGVDCVALNLAADEVAWREEAPLSGRRIRRETRNWPTTGLPVLCVSIDGGPDALFAPMYLPQSSGWIRLGSAPRPSNRRERFVHHVAHGLLMHYPLHRILSFAFTDLFTPFRSWWQAPDQPEDGDYVEATRQQCANAAGNGS